MTSGNSATPKRLAIIGGGCSGLITLKYALDQLRDWQIVCYEKSANITGVWGKPYEGFVSTSTKYTTQFACHVRYDTQVRGHAGSYQDFFQESEYGDYLEEFAKSQGLNDYIVRNCAVERVTRETSGAWRLSLRTDQSFEEVFSSVILCTGLAHRAKTFHGERDGISALLSGERISGKKIVVVGGGESAVDVAQRLSNPALGNQVYLSLRSGIRVSPRYHPIRGVPSDFLRTRLMISIHEDLRNAIGHKFVTWRIKYEDWFRKLFPGQGRVKGEKSTEAKRAYWDLKLTDNAKGPLFNVFHNKSEGFLDSVAEGRITIVGANSDERYSTYYDFDSTQTLEVNPDLVIPSIGYDSGLAALSTDGIELKDFYLGCIHVTHPNLFLVGFTRPIIGNIPSISEVQARYVIGTIAGTYPRSATMATEHAAARQELQKRYPALNSNAVYPVDMFPYCDTLAKKMRSYPFLRSVKSLKLWLKILLSPASTTHYLNENFSSDALRQQCPYTPKLLIVALIAIKAIDLPYSAYKRLIAAFAAAQVKG